MKIYHFFILFFVFIVFTSCKESQNAPAEVWAEEILGDPSYQAISYGGYRGDSRDEVPTVEELKEDMKILSVMGIKIIRTYNTQQFEQAANLLKAIKELKESDSEFEMYVMLGAWIDCKGAWTDIPDHNYESLENNQLEINAAVEMANTYPDIVKIIAVGNEAMVHWASSYFVYPNVILKWVQYLQDLKKTGKLPEKLWITSSDNFASWGGADDSYHTEDLTALINAVDFISMHTYPFHDTHYNPVFWGVPTEEESLDSLERIDAAMLRAKEYAMSQYQHVADYVSGLGIDKPIHIGETGWSSVANKFYDSNGSRAADEYKGKLYYQHMRSWTDTEGMSCFYFEAFDEKWKDSVNENGPENHFGLINLEGEAKYALWDQVDQGVFKGLTRNGKEISKSYVGDESKLILEILSPPLASELGLLSINTVNEKRNAGDKVSEGIYVITSDSMIPDEENDITYPSAPLKINPWEGTCAIEMSGEGVISIETSPNDWWGCSLELQGNGFGEDLTNYVTGTLHFEIKGNTAGIFNLGFQSGIFAEGNQVNNFVTFGPSRKFSIQEEWQSMSIPVAELNKGADLTNITNLLYLRGGQDLDGKEIFIKNVYFKRD